MSDQRFPILLDRPRTPKETAERITRWHFHLSDDEKLSKMHGHGTLADAIEAALDAERERCAKILEDRVLTLKEVKHPTNHNTWEQLDLVDLAAKIRGKQ